MPTKHEWMVLFTLKVKIISRILDGIKIKQEANGDLSHSVSIMMETGLNRDKNYYGWLLL